MRVSEVMIRTVWTCRPTEPMSAAARLMWEHDIGAVPVVDAEGKLVGIVTDRDLCMSSYFTGEPIGAVAVEHAMSTVVFTVEPGQSVEAAEELMRAKQIRRLPVVEAGKLAGMITLGDLARAAKSRRGVEAGDVNITLAAIVEPRVAPAAVAA